MEEELDAKKLSNMFSISLEQAAALLESSDNDLTIAVNSYIQSQSNTQPPPKPTNERDPNSHVGTLQSISSSKSHPGEQHAYFVGGGGQQVLGRPKIKSPPPPLSSSPDGLDTFIKTIFQSARMGGAEIVDSEPNKATASPPPFTGAGHRLDSPTPTTSAPASIPSDRNELQVTVKFWKNGVSYNDDKPMPYEDPDTNQLITYLALGKIPPAVLRLSSGGLVDLKMEDHRNEEWKAPPVKPFSGQGRKLGVPAPRVVGAPSSSVPEPATANTDYPQAIEPHNFDLSTPFTYIRVRLAQGTSLLFRMNRTQRIADLRQLIDSNDAVSAGREYGLHTAFPRRELMDNDCSIADANLLNAVILQRFK